jgi:inosine/xanthosine triphosphatase
MSRLRITIGSMNQIKIAAVRDVIVTYPNFADADVQGLDVGSGVKEQPTSLVETVSGALYRAAQVLETGAGDIAVGIESGCFPLAHPALADGVMLELCACCVLIDGFKLIGLSSAWALPGEIRWLVEQGRNLNQAFHDAKYTKNENLGNAEGAVGLLSGGRLTRRQYTAQAVQAALVGFNVSHPVPA